MVARSREMDNQSTSVFRNNGWFLKKKQKTTRENMEDYFDLMNDLGRKDWFDIIQVTAFDAHNLL